MTWCCPGVQDFGQGGEKIARRRRRGAGTPAGLVSGPRMLKSVRTPSSRRGAMACFMAPCWPGANMKPTPSSPMQGDHLGRGQVEPDAERLQHVGAAAFAGDGRLPCLATWQPAPAATNALAVEMLNVPAPSPPVPTVSTRGSPCTVPASRVRASRGRRRDLVDRFALHAQAHQEGADLRRCGTPVMISA